MARPEPAPLPIRSPEALGEAIARHRINADLTQDELAESMGVSRRYIYNIESGEPNLYARRLFDALRELGLRIEVVPDAGERRHRAGSPPARIESVGDDAGASQ